VNLVLLVLPGLPAREDWPACLASQDPDLGPGPRLRTNIIMMTTQKTVTMTTNMTTTGTTPLLLRWTTMLGRRRTLAPGSSVNPPPAEAPTSPWESAAPSAHQGRLSALSQSTPGVGVAPKRVGQAARDLLDHPDLRDHSLTLDLCSTRCPLRVERRDHHPIPSPTCRRKLGL